MKYYIGLDLSLTGTGICVLDEKANIKHISTIKTKARGMERLNYIANSIDDVLVKYPNITVYLEGYSYGSQGKIFEIGELGGVVKLMLYSQSITPKIIPPTVLKKFVIGKGGGPGTKKEDMKLFAYKKWKVEFATNDECDSYCLAMLALEEDVKCLKKK